jgi:hypothetical protein
MKLVNRQGCVVTGAEQVAGNSNRMSTCSGWLILASGFVTIAGTGSQAWQAQTIGAFATGFSEPPFLNIVGRVIGSPMVTAALPHERCA